MGSASKTVAALSWNPVQVAPCTSLVVVGYAKVPRTSGAHGNADLLAVSLRIDRITGRVLDADSTAASAVVRTWIADLLIGIDFAEDVSAVLAEVEEHYLSNAAGSLKQAILDAWRRYGLYVSR